MKKLLIICGLLFGTIAFAQAQNAEHKKNAAHKTESNEARAKMKAEKLAKKLDLNRDQTKRIEDIYLEEDAEMAKRHKKGMSDKAEMMKIHEETDAKIKSELTAAQKEKYEAWKMENEKHMKKEKKM